MKLNYEFVKREIAGERMLVPVGEAARVFNGIITINETAAFIFDCLPECSSKDQIAQKMAEEFDISGEEAASDINEFFEMLSATGIEAE